MTLVTLKSNTVSIAHNRCLSSSVDKEREGLERERRKEGSFPSTYVLPSPLQILTKRSICKECE